MYNQIIHVIPKSWKNSLLKSSEEHHLIRKHQSYCLNSREIYNILKKSNELKPSSQVSMICFFKSIYILAPITTKQSQF